NAACRPPMWWNVTVACSLRHRRRQGISARVADGREHGLVLLPDLPDVIEVDRVGAPSAAAVQNEPGIPPIDGSDAVVLVGHGRKACPNAFRLRIGATSPVTATRTPSDPLARGGGQSLLCGAVVRTYRVGLEHHG